VTKLLVCLLESETLFFPVGDIAFPEAERNRRKVITEGMNDRFSGGFRYVQNADVAALRGKEIDNSQANSRCTASIMSMVVKISEESAKLTCHNHSSVRQG
jgi:hypothetical protein